jgi:hypothetical protein
MSCIVVCLSVRMTLHFVFLFFLPVEGVARSNLPEGLVNQSTDEIEYLGYHKCVDAGEAYGAAYLITMDHLRKQSTNYSLNWVNCEMASFIMVKPHQSL